MGGLRAHGASSRPRRTSADSVRPPSAEALPAGVPNHLLARLLSSTPPAVATIQRTFTHKKKKIPEEAKVPTIHGVSKLDLEKLANDKEYDYGEIKDRATFDAALAVYTERHRTAETVLPLDQSYAGYRTVSDDVSFAEFEGAPVRATFQLDSMQGKHDVQFASGPDARKKSGGSLMPRDTDYETLAQGVPAELTRARLGEIFATPERAAYNYSVQRAVQDDGYQYEISARWAATDAGRHVLVFYHCYPPKK